MGPPYSDPPHRETHAHPHSCKSHDCSTQLKLMGQPASDLSTKFAWLTSDMQVECCCIIAQHVLCQRCHTHDASGFVDMFDSLLRPAQVRVGHCCPITEIQLNVGPHGVALKPQEEISCEWTLTTLSHENVFTEAEPAWWSIFKKV